MFIFNKYLDVVVGHLCRIILKRNTYRMCGTFCLHPHTRGGRQRDAIADRDGTTLQIDPDRHAALESNRLAVRDVLTEKKTRGGGDDAKRRIGHMRSFDG